MQKAALPIVFLFVVLVVANCGPTTLTSPNENSTNRQTEYQPTPSLSSATTCPTPSPDPNRKIVITAPCNDAKVAPRYFVEGVVPDSNAQVWLVTHPMETSDYWVQPSVTVREGGKWKVLCYFGEVGSQHSGKHYEVIAFISPKEKLREGQLLSGWPDAQSKSQVIEVVRE